MMSALGQLGGRLYRGEVSFDFVGRKRLWYAVSGLILLVSIVAVLVRGLSFSVLREDGVLDGEGVLPGFRLPLAKLFR